MLKITRKYLVIGLVILVIGGLVWKRRNQTIAVEVYQVGSGVVRKTVTVSGEVVPLEEADLGFPLVGKIYKILVSEGDVVTAGQVLAYLDNLGRLEAVRSAEAQLESAQENRRELKETYEDDGESFVSLDVYRSQLLQEDATVRYYESQLRSAQSTLGNGVISSPIDGIVTEVLVTEGEPALAGATIIKVKNPRFLIFEGDLDQEDVTLVKVGQAAAIELDAFPGQERTGTLSKIANYPKEDASGSKVFPIEISVDEDSGLQLGLEGDAYIITEQVEGLRVPLDTLEEDDEGEFVWLVDSGRVIKRRITTGLEGDQQIEVLSGLSEGELVVLSPPELEPGQKVTISAETIE